MGWQYMNAMLYQETTNACLGLLLSSQIPHATSKPHKMPPILEQLFDTPNDHVSPVLVFKLQV